MLALSRKAGAIHGVAGTQRGGKAAALDSRGRSLALLTTALVVSTLLLFLCSLVVGSRTIPLPDLFSALLHRGEAEIESIVWDLRIPRTFLAYFAGAAIAVSGVIAQSWTRNPLADPGFIGITAGASFLVALGTAVGIATSTGMRTALALLGAGVATTLVLGVSRRFQDPLTLVLVGAGVAAALSSGAMLIGLYSTDVLDSMRRWTIGSTFGRGPEDVAIAGIGLLVGLIIAARVARPLDLLAMGEESSVALGGSPSLTRRGAALSIVILAGCATAATGPVAFVGFAIPHLLRRLTGPEVAAMIAPAALLGGCSVLAADILGRLIAGPSELEMSIVVAFVGAPFLIWAVHRGEYKL